MGGVAPRETVEADGAAVLGRAEEALRTAREELRAVVEHIYAGVVVHGADTRVLLANRRASELLGLSPEQMLGKMAVDAAWCFLREDGTPMPVEEYPVRRVVDSCRPVQNLVAGIRHPGPREDTWLLTTAFPEFDDEGRLSRVVVTFVDMTEQRRIAAEAAAVAMVSRAFHQDEPLDRIYPEIARRLAAKLPFPIASIELHDRDRGEMVFVGTAGEGCPPTGLRVPVGDTISGQVALTGEPFVGGAVSGDPSYRSESLRRLGVETFVSVPVVVDAAVVGTISLADSRARSDAGSWVDTLTTVASALAQEIGRRRSNEALRASELKYRRLHESMTDAFVSTAMDGRLLEFNRAYLELLGYSEGELRELTYADLTPERWRAFESEIVRTQVLTRGSSDVYEKEYRRKDGAIFPVELRTFLVRDREGQPETMWAIVRDITDRKRSEEALVRTQKLEALGTLAGGVAHDFNNILVAIRGYAALAASDLAEDDPVRRYIDEIERAGVRASALVRRILTFAKPQRSVSVAGPLAPVVDESLKLLRATIPALIEIRTQWDADAPPSAIDAVQVQQVVLNVVNNAVDAIGPRAGVIALRLERADVAAGSAPGLEAGTYARLSVTDDGAGIDPATLERVLDPFFTTKPAGKGTGLGLSTVHGIMKGHGGCVAIVSQPGRGTRVDLYFPAATAPSPSTSAAAPEALQARSHRVERLLYVDDEEAILFLARKLLGREGYRVTTFDAPRAALAEFLAHPADFDALISDISMPTMSGFDLAAEFLAVRPDLPVVITSGFVRPEDEDRAARLGVRAILSKPNSVEDLATTLDRIFRADAGR